jgi:hypothetical protein
VGSKLAMLTSHATTQGFISIISAETNELWFNVAADRATPITGANISGRFEVTATDGGGGLFFQTFLAGQTVANLRTRFLVNSIGGVACTGTLTAGSEVPAGANATIRAYSSGATSSDAAGFHIYDVNSLLMAEFWTTPANYISRIKSKGALVLHAGNVGWSATNDFFYLDTSGTITLKGGYLVFTTDSTGIRWTDGNSQIFATSGRIMYFDQFSNGWVFRDSSNGATILRISGASSYGMSCFGNVNPTALVHVVGSQPGGLSWAYYSNATADSLNYGHHALFVSDTGGAAGNGGTIFFGAATTKVFAGIRGYFTNGGGNSTGNLSFALRLSTSDPNMTQVAQFVPATGMFLLNYGIGVYGSASTYGFNAPNVANTTGIGLAYRWDVYSSLDSKSDIEPFGSALALVRNDDLQGIRYTHTNGGVPSIGFVAEHWLPYVPEAVTVNEDGKPVGMDYGRVGVITFQALKELASKFAAAEERIAELEAKLAA